MHIEVIAHSLIIMLESQTQGL